MDDNDNNNNENENDNNGLRDFISKKIETDFKMIFIILILLNILYMNQFFNSENKIMSNKDNLQLFEMKKNY